MIVAVSYYSLSFVEWTLITIMPKMLEHYDCMKER